MLIGGVRLNLAELVETIFSIRGYKLRISTETAVTLSNGDSVLVIPLGNVKLDKAALSRIAADHAGDRKVVIICVEHVEMPEPSNLEIWDRSRAERELGSAVLDILALGKESHCIMIDNSPTKMVNEDIIKPRLALEDAAKLSLKMGGAVNLELRLVPFYIIDYDCGLFIEGEAHEERIAGTLRVDGITGECSELSDNLETAPKMDWTHHKFEPRFDINAAMQKARASLVAEKTRVVEAVRDLGSAKLYEKKKLAPRGELIKLTSRGIVYWPIWHIECAQGKMTIDSATCSVLREEQFKR